MKSVPITERVVVTNSDVNKSISQDILQTFVAYTIRWSSILQRFLQQVHQLVHFRLQQICEKECVLSGKLQNEWIFK